MKLKKIAHSRTGDKGDIAIISLIAYEASDYPLLKERVTAEAVASYFADILHCNVSSVTRYEVDSLCALNFVIEHALGGGVTRSLAIDMHGKSLSSALLEMDI